MLRFPSFRGLVWTLCISFAWFVIPAARCQVILVQPYVQPGDGRTLSGADVKVVRWLTDQTPGEFIVEFQVQAGALRVVKPTRTALDFPPLKMPPPAAESPKSKARDEDSVPEGAPRDQKPPRVPQPAEKEQHYFRYTAVLEDLPFDTAVRYQVKQGERVLREAGFRTRATAEKTVRCVLMGDMAEGRDTQRAIAFQISKQQPDFLVALGDIVYPTGRVTQYMHFFWDTYNNVTEAGPKTGAPLMASVPFYPVLGNHDVSARLPLVPDALGAYYFFAPPRGGPGEGPWITPLGNDPAVAAKFRAATLDSYPNLDDYSFDYGPAHFVVLNDNRTMKLDAPGFRTWLSEDLKASRAKWKFVCFHIPGFQSTPKHYVEQQIRPLHPILEAGGVDMTFAGHVHNYQRGVPLRFTPEGDRDVKGRVIGRFSLDTHFDGAKNLTPDGIIHMIEGGGGASLDGPGLDKTAPWLKKEHGANYADFTAKVVTSKHSFLLLDIAPDGLHLRAIAADGEQLDQIRVRK
jgi:hypothetical protein